MNKKIPLSEIAKAIFTINRHAKTASEPQHLYQIKKEAIDRLLSENRAKKIGLHFSNHPKFSNQHSTILISVGDYYFHILPEKQDFEELDHLGALDENYRNPRTKMSLSHAKKIIYQYIGWRPTKTKKHVSKRKYSSAYYTPSSLGKMEWPPHKPHRMR